MCKPWLLAAALLLSACRTLPPGPDGEFLGFLAELEALPESRRQAYLEALWDLRTAGLTTPVRDNDEIVLVLRSSADIVELESPWLNLRFALNRIAGTDLWTTRAMAPLAQVAEYRLYAGGVPVKDPLNPYLISGLHPPMNELRHPRYRLPALSQIRPGAQLGRLRSLRPSLQVYEPAVPPAPGAPVLVFSAGPQFLVLGNAQNWLDNLIYEQKIPPVRAYFSEEPGVPPEAETEGRPLIRVLQGPEAAHFWRGIQVIRQNYYTGVILIAPELKSGDTPLGPRTPRLFIAAPRLAPPPMPDLRQPGPHQRLQRFDYQAGPSLLRDSLGPALEWMFEGTFLSLHEKPVNPDWLRQSFTIIQTVLGQPDRRALIPGRPGQLSLELWYYRDLKLGFGVLPLEPVQRITKPGEIVMVWFRLGEGGPEEHRIHPNLKAAFEVMNEENQNNRAYEHVLDLARLSEDTDAGPIPAWGLIYNRALISIPLEALSVFLPAFLTSPTSSR